MRILFMGTPDFAAVSLERLYDRGHDICRVFTRPDKPKGRGMKLAQSPVKELALAHGASVYQPEGLKSAEAAAVLAEAAPELIVVVAYGRILPLSMLEYPKLGAVNLHASLLPKYRGSAPIQRQVLNGDKIGGVTTMHMAEGLDTGDIIEQAETEIGLYETSGELFERLGRIGAELLCSTVDKLEAGVAPRRAQDESQTSIAPRLTREDSPIDWSRGAYEIVKQVCGLDPWPCALMTLDGAPLKVFGARLTGRSTAKRPGEVVSAGSDGLEMACGGGETVLLTELQAVGKRRMSASEYLRGHPTGAKA